MHNAAGSGGSRDHRVGLAAEHGLKGRASAQSTTAGGSGSDTPDIFILATAAVETGCRDRVARASEVQRRRPHAARARAGVRNRTGRAAHLKTNSGGQAHHQGGVAGRHAARVHQYAWVPLPRARILREDLRGPTAPGPAVSGLGHDG